MNKIEDVQQYLTDYDNMIEDFVDRVNYYMGLSDYYSESNKKQEEYRKNNKYFRFYYFKVGLKRDDSRKGKVNVFYGEEYSLDFVAEYNIINKHFYFQGFKFAFKEEAIIALFQAIKKARIDMGWS